MRYEILSEECRFGNRNNELNRDIIGILKGLDVNSEIREVCQGWKSEKRLRAEAYYSWSMEVPVPNINQGLFEGNI